MRKRIIQFLEYKGESKYRFYQKTGLSNGFLDKNNAIGSDKYEIISKCYPELNMEWAISGAGEMLSKNKGISEAREDQALYNTIKAGIPLIPIEAMAGLSSGDATVLEVDSERYLVPEFKNKADFMIRLSGTSMSPKYYNGDVVACRKIPKDTFIQWGKVYIMDTVQGALCKRLFPSEKGEDFIKVVSDNPSYPAFEMHKENDIRALAIVIGVIRLE